MKKSVFRAFGIFLIGAMALVSSRAQTATAPGKNGGVASTAGNADPSRAQVGAKPARADQSYTIGDDDLLAISVWKEPDLTKQIPVRSDGKISLPLIGDVQASGRTPSQLQDDISDKLKSYITDPQVSVIVQEIRSLKFNILGMVAKPGSYSLTSGMTVVDAVAIAGGFRDFAKKKGIYVLRPNPGAADSRFDFNYQDFIKGKNADRNVVLKPRDTIVVP